MKKMYSNIPVVDTEDNLTPIPENIDNEKRIKYLEERVRRLSEQVHQLASALQLNSRQMRRANTDITNLTTVLRNKKG